MCAIIFAKRINIPFQIAQPIVPSGYDQFYPVQPVVMAYQQPGSPNVYQPVLMSEFNQFRPGQPIMLMALPPQPHSPSSGSPSFKF